MGMSNHEINAAIAFASKFGFASDSMDVESKRMYVMDNMTTHTYATYEMQFCGGGLDDWFVYDGRIPEVRHDPLECFDSKRTGNKTKILKDVTWKDSIC